MKSDDYKLGLANGFRGGVVIGIIIGIIFSIWMFLFTSSANASDHRSCIIKYENQEQFDQDVTVILNTTEKDTLWVIERSDSIFYHDSCGVYWPEVKTYVDTVISGYYYSDRIPVSLTPYKLDIVSDMSGFHYSEGAIVREVLLMYRLERRK